MTQPKHGPPVTTASADLTAERLAHLQDLFPEAFTEGQIDFDKLRAALGEAIDERPERYSFSWAGKSDAIRLLQTPTSATLLPAPEESLNWDSTQNLFIEGDNLEVLKLLYKSYFGRVKMIYIDPPYNTGNDFIYPDNYAAPLETYLQLTGQTDAEGNILTSNAETSGRYHSAWLTMIYPRLFVARQLLREDGVILISIDDTEVANLKLVLNEIFGEENFVGHLVWQKRYVSNVTAQYLSDMHDHVLVYARQKEQIEVNKLPRTEDQLKAYQNPDNDPRGPWRAQDLSASKYYAAGLYTITTPAGLEAKPPPGRYWRCNEQQYEKWLADNRIWFGKSGEGRPMLKAFLSESQEGVTPNTWWDFKFAGHNKEATLETKALFEGGAPFDTSKPVKLMRRMLELFTNSDGLVVDFFAGSCTLAQAILEQNRSDGGNRSFLVVQLPEKIDTKTETGKNAKNLGLGTIADIGKERIRRVIAQMEAEDEGKLDLSTRDTPEDLGFKVFKLAPSHLKPWSGTAEAEPEEFANQMQLFTDPLRDGWTPTGVVTEIALKEGYSLTSTIERMVVAGEDVFKVTDPDKGQQFHICLENTVKPDVVATLGLGTDDLFICRDVALDDTAAANLALQCRLKVI